MKRFAISTLLLSVAPFLFSETWTFDTSKLTANTNLTLTESFGTADTDGWWKNSAGEYMRGQGIAAGDTLVINNNTPYRVENLMLDSAETTIASLEAGGSTWTFIRGSQKTNKLTIDGDLKLISENLSINNCDLWIKGDLNAQSYGMSLGRSSGNPLHHVVIDGDVYGTATKTIFFQVNGMTASRPAEEQTFENGLANPDMVIKGIVKDISMRDMGDNVDHYIQLGGLSGNNAQVSRQIYTDKGAGANTYFIFANTQSYTAGGMVYEYNDSRILAERFGSTVYVMNGTGTQEFSNNTLFFHGGVKVLSGTLKMNFNQSTSQYWHYSDNSATVRVDYYTDASGSTATTTSHGDLEMGGGVFASADGDDTYGSFRLTNVVYKDGTIKLRLDGTDKMDSLDLTGYYSKASDSESLVAIAGGTVKMADGAEGQVTFDFGENLDWLVEAEGDGVKVIAWDAENKTELLADDFTANIFSNESGDYKALFTVNDDGLYVKYVVVPEPSTVAFCLGALALAVAFFRRRK